LHVILSWKCWDDRVHNMRAFPVTNPKLVEGRLSWHIKNLNISQSYLDCRGYSCHQGLLSTWHDTNHTMRLMKWWFILLTVKPGNTLIVCILTFQLNQGTCILGCVQTDSTHSGHLLLFYLWSYQVRAIRGGI